MHLYENNKPTTAWKVSVFGVFLLRIFPYSDWIHAVNIVIGLSPDPDSLAEELKRVVSQYYICLNALKTIDVHWKLIFMDGEWVVPKWFSGNQMPSSSLNWCKDDVILVFLLLTLNIFHTFLFAVLQYFKKIKLYPRGVVM